MEFVYEKVSIEDAKRVLDGHNDGACEQPNRTMRRGPSTEGSLLPATLTWMVQLPQKVRPFTLARHFPRIANELCRRWKLTARCELYLDELLIVDRAGRKRQGFPPQVVSEIAALAWYHLELHPQAKSWPLACHRVQLA